MPEETSAPFDIGAKLKQRLEATKLQKDATQLKINTLNNELQTLFSKIPKRPRESMTELDDKINALEFKRTTNSMPLNQEKSILKEMHQHQKVKLQLEEYNLYERKVQEKKGQLTDLREALKITTMAIDELETALNKVRLATKLGCTPSELTTDTMTVPVEKIGRIIGKSGSTIAELEKTAKVNMDVDSVGGKILMTGSPASIEHAKTEINKILDEVDNQVRVPSDVLQYFTTKRIAALEAFRERHPEVQIDAIREKGVVALRGPPLDVQAAKMDLLDISLASDTRILIGRESGIIVGKSGNTINRLSETHKVTLDVKETGEDVFSCTVIGAAEGVASCVAEIDIILADNKDTTEMLPVDAIMRNTLLVDNGVPIKALQKKINAAVEGNIMLSFHKENDQQFLQIRGKAVSVKIAKEICQSELNIIQSSLVTLDVDPFIVPVIIGKGGETIKKLKANGTVNIDVDKTGRVVIQSSDVMEVVRVETELRALLEENQLVRIPLPVTSAKAMFRELVRSDKKEEINELVWIGLDDEKAHVLLRGTKENVTKVTAIANEFLENNYIQEVEISAEDEPTLLAGGSDSPIQKFQDEYGADMSVIRSRFVVIVKGNRNKVGAAVKRLNQFLHGGDGFKVSRISVTDQSLGLVIGKGGCKRAELEKQHEGVHLFIHRTNRITIRGPENAVESCRIDILRLVSSIKVNQVESITPEEHAILTKPDNMRRITQGIPVQVTLTDDSVKIRGIFADVRDAQTLMKEVLTGVYEASVELEASQLPWVRGACRDPSHFERIRTTTNAEVELDLNINSIVMKGKRSNVRKAKSMVVTFLDFVLPHDFARFEISKPLQTTVGEAAALADCAAVSGAKIYLDRDLSSIIVQSSDPTTVKKAAEIIKAKIDEAEQLVSVVTFGNTEHWLIPLVIGKGGNRVNTLRLDTGCNIDVNKVDRTVTITGDDTESVKKARAMLDEVIDEARRQVAFIDIPSDSMALFVGRGGSHIRSFATAHTVEVERMRKSVNRFKISGDEANVQAAKKAAEEWISHWEVKQAGITIAIDKPSIGAVVGKQGSVISALQKEYDCKVEIDKDELTLTVRGGTEESRDKAIEKIKQIIHEDKERHQSSTSRRSNGENGDNDNGDNANGEKAGPATNGYGSKSDAPKSTDNSLSILDSRKDRSTEFARRPVGLTVVEKEASKPKKKRIRNKKGEPRDISDDSTLQVGTSAGRSLFNLLVSESSTNIHEKDDPTVMAAERTARKAHSGVSMMEEQWDSSTVSSVAIENSDPFDEAQKKPYVKSASGFTVRV